MYKFFDVAAEVDVARTTFEFPLRLHAFIFNNIEKDMTSFFHVHLLIYKYLDKCFDIGMSPCWIENRSRILPVVVNHVQILCYFEMEPTK